VRYDINVFENAKHHGNLYNKLINQCVNYELRQYKLRAHSTIEYCISNQHDSEYFGNDFVHTANIVKYIASTIFSKFRLAGRLFCSRVYVHQPGRSY
jgi:hypothetical protein